MLLHATTGNNSEAVTARTIGISDSLSCHLTQDIPPLHALPTASSIDFSLPWKAHPDAPSSLAMPGSSSHAPCRAASEMNPHTAWARLWTSAGQRTQRLGAKGFSDRAAFLGRLKRLTRNRGGQGRLSVSRWFANGICRATAKNKQGGAPMHAAP